MRGILQQREITIAIASDELKLSENEPTRMSINGVAWNATSYSVFENTVAKVESAIDKLLLSGTEHQHDNMFNVDKALQEYLEMFGDDKPAQTIPVLLIYAATSFSDTTEAIRTADQLRQLGHHVLIVTDSDSVKSEVKGVADDESSVEVFSSSVSPVVSWFHEKACKFVWQSAITTMPIPKPSSTKASTASLTSAHQSPTTTTALITSTPETTATHTTKTATISTTMPQLSPSPTPATTAELPTTTTTVYVPRPCDISANKIYASIFLDITPLGQPIKWQRSLTSAIAMKMGLHEGGCTRMSVSGVADATTPDAIFEGSLDAVEKDIQHIMEIASDYQSLFEFNVAG
ncbi:unnamed protein product [Toxocara canis]|uniref:VWFA domain-containing protein n=1 Tax=Toxocara canis TaxID=6265 RepID=A0A183U2P2_TOXCA|nr:unnamed protein product [Toxocara canis]